MTAGPVGAPPAARSRLIAAIFAAGAVLFCAGLGVWQIERLHWKTNLIADRQAAITAPAQPPPATLGEARHREFHPVIAEGTFLHDKETYLHTLGPKGELGFAVLTPLRGTDGGTILVDRGFVPADRKNTASRAAGNPDGSVRLQAFLRLPPASKPGWFLPDNQPQAGEWFWLDLPAIATAKGITNLAPFYLQAGTTPNPGGWPKGSDPDPGNLPNNHLQYAITWFSLAAAAAGVYVLSQRRTFVAKAER